MTPSLSQAAPDFQKFPLPTGGGLGWGRLPQQFLPPQASPVLPWRFLPWRLQCHTYAHKVTLFVGGDSIFWPPAGPLKLKPIPRFWLVFGRQDVSPQERHPCTPFGQIPKPWDGRQDDCKVGSFSILSESCFTGLNDHHGWGPSAKSQNQTNHSSDKDFAIALGW